MAQYDIGFGALHGPGLDGVLVKSDPTLVVPNVVLGVDYATDPVNGHQTARVTATWGTPSVGEDLGKTTKNKVTAYYVSERHGLGITAGVTWSAERKITGHTSSLSGLNLSSLLEFRVRARTGGGQYGPYTNANINTALDVTPPPKPSTPVLKGIVRGVQVTWDGKDYLGQPQPIDFDRAEAEISTTSATAGFSPVLGFGRDGGSLPYQSLNLAAAQYWCRIKSFDLAQNGSVYSDVATAFGLSFTAFINAEGGGNAVLNSSFEDVTVPQVGAPAKWTVSGTLTSTRVSVPTQNGGAAQQLSVASGEAYISQVVPCLPDTDYTVSAYVQPGSGTTFSDRSLRVVESTTTTHDAVGYSTLAAGAMSRVTTSFHTTSTTNTLEVRLYGATGSATWDSVQVETGTSASAYAPRPGEIGFTTVTTAQLADLAVTSSKIAGDAVTTSKVLANSITASKLTIGSLGDNSVRNGSFEDNAGRPGYICDGWTALAGNCYQAYGQGAGGSQGLALGPNSSAISDPFPVEPGRYYYLGAEMKGSGLYLRFLTSSNQYALPGDSGSSYTDCNYAVTDSTSSAQGSVFTTATSGMQLLQGQALVPAGQVWGRVVLYGTSSGTDYADAVFARKVNGSTMISDGAIWTDKVSAKGIVADRIAAGTITANISMSSPTINGGTINAARFIGGKVSAAIVESGQWFDYRVLIGESANVKDSIRWYAAGYSEATAYQNAQAEIRGKMGEIHQYGVHINGHCEIGNPNSSIWQTGVRVAVGPGINGYVRTRSKNGEYVYFDSNSTARINFESYYWNPPTFVAVTFLTFACVYYVDNISSSGFDLHARRVNANDNGSMSGVGCQIMWYAEQFNVDPFYGYGPAF